MYLEWEELEPGAVCFVRPSREDVELEVVDIDEESITLRKC